MSSHNTLLNKSIGFVTVLNFFIQQDNGKPRDASLSLDSTRWLLEGCKYLFSPAEWKGVLQWQLDMDDFCGDVQNAWGISAKGYFTHCFDDLILFGSTYVFIFVFGSYRAWTLLHTPTKDEFPYSTRHSVKVMVLGWLGLFPMIIFASKYSNGVHDDFEWVAKPLASLAWLYSLWILNMEVARDLRE